MALSRLAKKFRELEKKQEQPGQNPAPSASKKATKVAKAPAKPAEPPAPPAAPIVAVVEIPAAPPEPPKPGKRNREAVKRPRFVYVPEKAERKAPSAAPVVPAPRSNKLSAKLMTKNLALPPDDETPAGPLGVLRGRL